MNRIEIAHQFDVAIAKLTGDQGLLLKHFDPIRFFVSARQIVNVSFDIKTLETLRPFAGYMFL